MAGQSTAATAARPTPAAPDPAAERAGLRDRPSVADLARGRKTDKSNEKLAKIPGQQTKN
jgi:hypothetical protein